MEPWIQTYSGRAVDPLKPDPEQLIISDIAHGLSHVNRYTGHTHAPYSVGLHSLTVARLVKMRGHSIATQLWALLHDGTEAYLNDISAPVKQHEVFAGYRAAEKNLDVVIRERFTMGDAVELEAVRTADWDILLAERPWVMPPGAWEMTRSPPDALEAFNWGKPILAAGPAVVRAVFEAMFDTLGGVR